MAQANVAALGFLLTPANAEKFLRWLRRCQFCSFYCGDEANLLTSPLELLFPTLHSAPAVDAAPHSKILKLMTKNDVAAEVALILNWSPDLDSKFQQCNITGNQVQTRPLADCEERILEHLGDHPYEAMRALDHLSLMKWAQMTPGEDNDRAAFLQHRHTVVQELLVPGLVFERGQFVVGDRLTCDHPQPDHSVICACLRNSLMTGSVAVDTLRYAATLVQHLLLHLYFHICNDDPSLQHGLFSPNLDGPFDIIWNELAVRSGSDLSLAIGRIRHVNIPFAEANFTDMFFEFSLMEEEGLVPPDVIAVILEKFNARLEFARSLQMHNQSVDYWESALRFGFAFGFGACSSFISHITDRLALCRASGQIRVYPFTSIKENLVDWSRLRRLAADGDAEGAAYMGPPFLSAPFHPFGRMEFCWDGRVVDTVMKLMHHNFNFFHGGREFLQLLESLVGKRVKSEEEENDEAFATIEYDAYVQDRGEGESVMAIEQFVNSRMDPFDQKELYLELISDLKAFMESEFDVDSSPHPAFHARCRELDHDNLQAPAPADLQMRLAAAREYLEQSGSELVHAKLWAAEAEAQHAAVAPEQQLPAVAPEAQQLPPGWTLETVAGGRTCYYHEDTGTWSAKFPSAP